jgi:hypothetical protein
LETGTEPGHRHGYPVVRCRDIEKLMNSPAETEPRQQDIRSAVTCSAITCSAIVAAESAHPNTCTSKAASGAAVTELHTLIWIAKFLSLND